MVNDNDDWSPEHDTDTLSSVKKQKLFCEQNIAEFLMWQQENTDSANKTEESKKKDKAGI